jgi:hypothetical protein
MIGRTLAALALVAAGWFGHAWTANDAGPHCPTEDTCTIDYGDGAWHVTETTP